MDSGVDKGQGEPGKVLRCARCGVQSPERTCFIVPEQYSRPPRDVRCITCEQRRLTPTTTRALLAVFASVFWPLWLVVGLAPADVELGAPTLIFACLLYPLAVHARARARGYGTPGSARGRRGRYRLRPCGL